MKTKNRSEWVRHTFENWKFLLFISILKAAKNEFDFPLGDNIFVFFFSTCNLIYSFISRFNSFAFVFFPRINNQQIEQRPFCIFTFNLEVQWSGINMYIVHSAFNIYFNYKRFQSSQIRLSHTKGISIFVTLLL